MFILNFAIKTHNMEQIIAWVSQPWPWYLSGILIALTMATLLYFGKSFGFSSNLATICAACGAGKTVPLFDFDWRKRVWNLLFLAGAVIGGWISANFLSTNDAVAISQETIRDLGELGFGAPEGLQPDKLFGREAFYSLKAMVIMLVGGFLIGFGTRYAGGCTSGHAISGLSDLQWPSLIAVAGFFTGGLITTFLLLPLLF